MRWGMLGRQSLWMDEGYSAWVSQPGHSPSRVVQLLQGDTAPPLYYLLLNGWARLVGHSEAGLRSLSTLLGTLTLGVFWLLARRLLKTPWAIALAVAWLALSPFDYYYNREARAYELMAFLATANLYLLLRYVEQPRPRWLVALVIGLAASLYTHNMMVFYLLALNAAWAVLAFGRAEIGRQLRAALAVNLAVALLYAPWIPTVLAQMQRLTGEFWLAAPRFDDLQRIWPELGSINLYPLWMLLPLRVQAWLWPMAETRYLQLVGLAMLSLLALALLRPNPGRPGARARTLALAVYLLAPVLAVYFYSRWKQPVFLARAFIATATLLPLLLVMGADAANRKSLRVVAGALAGLMVFLAGTSLCYFALLEPKENWRATAHFVRDAIAARPQRPILIFACSESQMPFDYYYHRQVPPDQRVPETGLPEPIFSAPVPRTMRRIKTDQDLAILRTALNPAEHDTVYLILSHLHWCDPAGRLDERIAPSWTEHRTRIDGHITVAELRFGGGME